MSLNKDPSGRRSVQVEVEVPGTPEQVWEAIATGPGVSSWFVPTEVEPGVGGSATAHFGPGMDSHATVTAWDPPRRFAATSPDLGPDAPALATEWIVEARAGGKCIVRVVHSLFASTDDWDDQLTNFESGWPSFFLILKLYLAHFRGLPCAGFRVMGVASAPQADAWSALLNALGLSGVNIGEHWNTNGAPPIGGYVEAIGGAPHAHELLRLVAPTPGIAFINAVSMGSQVYLAISFYLYGDQAAATARNHEPLWQAWMRELYPSLNRN